jgi:hypothetical protein
MTFHEYLSKAVQDDARRAGERNRLLLEARRARAARRPHAGPAAPASRPARAPASRLARLLLLFRQATPRAINSKGSVAIGDQ